MLTMAGCSKCILWSGDKELLYNSNDDSEYVDSTDLDLQNVDNSDLDALDHQFIIKSSRVKNFRAFFFHL